MVVEIWHFSLLKWLSRYNTIILVYPFHPIITTGEVHDITSSRKKTFIPELLHSASKDKEKEDCRLTLLNDEPALYDELCQVAMTSVI